jgi:6-pyruvoyltetrahydropterin/6-carboxytetrahydropterin synthase
MKAHLTRRYMFAAAHRLHSATLSDAKNREVYGKCNNPYGHGHNYAVEVTVSGQVDPSTGMICNLADLDACFSREVMERFDHRNLNTVPEFADKVPTTENLAAVIFHILKREFRSAHLEKVRIQETLNNSFEYCGEAQPCA